MNGALTYLYAAYFIASSMVLYLVNLVLVLFTSSIDPDRRTIHKITSRWAFHHVEINPFWRLKIEGAENIDESKAYILVANHQSYADILVLFGLKKPFKWVSKEAVFKVPGLGWNMEINRYVKIKRGDLKSTKEMMTICREWLNKGVSIMMFPEGTRSPDGELHPFKQGPFKLAAEANISIVPIVVDGTFPILPKGAKALNFVGDMRIRVLPAVNPADFQMDQTLLCQHVHDLMKDTLASMRAEQLKSNQSIALAR
ncbi:MAG TPA: lysophospholipid acyltransferase family protein [Candidatus Obscuribacterales bacterium]